MNKFQRVLVVIDANDKWSEASFPPELDKALRLFDEQSGVELKLLCVAYEKYLNHDYLSISYDQAEKRQDYINGLNDRLQAIASALANRGYSVSAETEFGHPRYKIVTKTAAEFQADLIVQHCRAYGKLEFGHLSNDSWQLVHHCDTPMLLVKNTPWQEQLTVIAAVDPMHSHAKPSGLDHKVLQGARQLADSSGGRLAVVHAFAEAARPFAVAGTIEAEHRKAFNELMDDFDVSADHQHVLDETPIAALQIVTDQFPSSLLAMGAVSRSRLHDMLIGSTTEQVLDFLPADVLLLKP